MILKIDTLVTRLRAKKLVQVGEESEPKKVFCLSHLFVEGLIK